MISTKKIRENADIAGASWVKAVVDIMKPQDLYLIGGRGVTKTTDILAGRSEDVVHEMPGGTFVFTADTYMNLMTNVIPSVMTGWEQRYDFYRGSHFVVDEEPPLSWLKAMGARNVLNWKHTISTYNGCLFYLTSLDRPSSNAGLSVIHIFGDEAKYLLLRKLNKLFPTLRGDPNRFGSSPYFLGKTFTSDMANPTIGEDPWMLEMAKNVDRQRALLTLETGLVVNEIGIELWDANLNRSDQKEIDLIVKKMERWKERHNAKRRGLVFYYNVSSFANADVLTLEYFVNLMKTMSKEEFNTSVLGIPTFVEKGKKFYPALNDRHFYIDGYDYAVFEKDSYRLGDLVDDDCRLLRFLDADAPIEAGFDAGNMCSLCIGQQRSEDYRILKNFFTLPEDYIPELANQFKKYFKFHRKKVLRIYHDRATNQYAQVKRDQASELKRHIEFNIPKEGKASPTGWSVELMSVGQANIEHEEEYNLMIMLMGEKDPRLPRLLIDQFNCKELKSSLELAEMQTVSGKIKKKKTSEKLPVRRLPMESTNMSDAFKYLMCRREWLGLLSNRGKTSSYGDPGIY